MTETFPQFDVPFTFELGVLHRGEIVHLEGDPARRRPVASVTKLVTALSAMVASRRAMVSVRDPAGPAGSTVGHLLAHASGLAQDGTEVLMPPGRRRIYSNAGYDVVGEVLEASTGWAVADWIEHTVLEPLGMTDTELEGSPAHGLTSSVRDLLALAQELAHPTLITPSQHALLTTPQWPDLKGVLPGYGRQNPNPWGMGAEIRARKRPHWTSAASSPQTFGHFGMAGTFLWVDPVRDAAAVFLGDEPFGWWHRDHWAQLNAQILAAIDQLG